MPVTLLYAGVFGLFAMVLSFFAGSYRGKIGVSILFSEPADMNLAQRVRVHQNFLEYVPMILIIMGAIELSGGSTMFLYVVGDLLFVVRIAHAYGLRHDQMNHWGRLVGAGGTALVTVAAAGYAVWLGANQLLG